MGGVTAFVGDVPRVYDAVMGPHFFEPFARDFAARLARHAPASVLTLACGTGIDVRAVKDALPEAQVVATDLNVDMLAVAAAKFGEGEVRFQVADAQNLPFPDACCDAVTCQFGLMFFPDKDLAIQEAYRVLKPGGTILFSVWDEMAQNPPSEAAHRLILEMAPDNPPEFWLTPYGYHDQPEIRSLFERNGFLDVTVEAVRITISVPDPARLAYGLTYGSPAYGQLLAHPEVDLAAYELKLAERLTALVEPMGTTTRQAIVIEARKPTNLS